MSQLKAQVDKLLTGVSSAYVPKKFICEDFFPEVQSKQYSGLLGKYGTSHLRIENAIKGGRGKYRRVETITRSTQQYVITGHGLEGFVSKEDYANVEDPFDAERDETMGLTTILFLEKEKMMADTITSTSIITNNTTLSGTSQFSDFTNSDPIGVASDARASILNATGSMPNVCVMDILTWNKLRFHPQMLDALGYKWARPGGLTEDEMARALGVDKILYSEARYESANEGQASAFAAVFGKDIVFALAPEKAEIMQQSIGYMIRPTGSTPRKTYKQTNFNPPGSSAILVEDEYDMLISNVGAAYLIKAAIA